MCYYRSKTRKYGLYFRVEYKNKESFKKKKEFIAKITNSDNKVKIIQKILKKLQKLINSIFAMHFGQGTP